jgi:hypothetical protein
MMTSPESMVPIDAYGFRALVVKLARAGLTTSPGMTVDNSNIEIAELP